MGALGGSEINEAKKILATEATAMLHGRAIAEEAAETARRTFEEGQSATGLPSISLDLDAVTTQRTGRPEAARERAAPPGRSTRQDRGVPA